MISLQTNVNALDAINNLNTVNAAQGKTIQQLSSGYRINSSADDAAGLAIANGYQNQVTQLTQGVNNANDGIAQLQIIDGGLGNISNILNRMQTLASESASGTFTGSRATLNQEYQNLIGEITRQASNIGLNSGGSFNTDLNVFIGGSSSVTNAAVSVNLSGSNSAVDATSLGLANSNILAGGVGFGATNSIALDAPDATFLNGGSQTFTFNIYSNGASKQVTATANPNAISGGETADQVLSDLNSSLSQYGITASVDNNGYLEFSGATPFTVTAAAASGSGTALTTGAVTNSVVNSANYTLGNSVDYAAPTGTNTDSLTFLTAAGQATVTLTASDTTVDSAVAAINAQTAALGVYAVASTDSAGNASISLQSSSSFSVNESAASVLGSSAGSYTATAPSTDSATANAESAITSIANAITSLGLVQGRVGAGENQLNYAVGLAQSQITNFSAAEGDIKDADVATQASNLTRYQVLEQTAVAALAQANSMPQAVLKLLQ
jgi:flagellin